MFQRAQLKQNSQRHFLHSIVVGLGLKKMRLPLPPHIIKKKALTLV
jgi:hypothetical protein